MKYLRALWLNIGPAAFDVLFISCVSLIPLFLARLTPLVLHQQTHLQVGWLWSLMTSGQLAFYALGSLGAIALVVYRGDALPAILRVTFGALSLIFLLFIAYLIGVDPSLRNAPVTFVGVTSFWIYVTTQLMTIAIGSFERFGPGSAIKAGDESSQATTDDLGSRKGTTDA